MSHNAQAIFFLIAFIAFAVAAIVAAIPRPKNWWAVLIGAGLAAWVFVLMYDAFAAS